jgi:chemotaxis protein methyltransferase CheR
VEPWIVPVISPQPDLNEDTFAHFQDLIRERTGIQMRDSKRILVANRLRKRLAAVRVTTYEEYYRYLTTSPRRAAELPCFINAISTNETCFYRGGAQLMAFERQILPELLRNRRALHLWSAGSSTGEEPYTLAMIARETARSSRWPGDIHIVATDINHEVIERARTGVYDGPSLRYLPPRYEVGYLERTSDGRFRVGDEIRSCVTFLVHNLLKDPPPGKRFDAIFCRNVLIYFDRQTQLSLIDGTFASVLARDGYLFIGSSESLLGQSARFRYAHIAKSPIYIPSEVRL